MRCAWAQLCAARRDVDTFSVAELGEGGRYNGFAVRIILISFGLLNRLQPTGANIGRYRPPDQLMQFLQRLYKLCAVRRLVIADASAVCRGFRDELRIITCCAFLCLWKPFHKRKNYLFAGSDAGGERAAAIYSLLGSVGMAQAKRRKMPRS